jgi:hypothetical protein
MIAQARITCAYSMLLAVVALAPTAVLAQGQNQQGPDQPKAAQAQTEDARRQPAQAQPEGSQTQPEGEQAQTEKDPKVISGMSILGNQEAPKALVIIPWKGSELGNAVGVTTMLDDSRLPIDKEVFMRMLSYYEIRSETARPGGAPPTKTNAAPATVAQRRKP